ncbi:uncharacterized protein UBRO_20987 [Ustilago bromivora]|uniref:Uncharacterized protein n=1 Tax=Ustilago bromivora TaxID=307758 RepID=A0A1K0GEJ0_9BASI|nr:uncharacterized protein UBRO_20987 [Ustilago bromivora]
MAYIDFGRRRWKDKQGPEDTENRLCVVRRMAGAKGWPSKRISNETQRASHKRRLLEMLLACLHRSSFFDTDTVTGAHGSLQLQKGWIDSDDNDEGPSTPARAM